MPKILGMPEEKYNALLKNFFILYDRGKIGTLRQCESVAYPLAEHFNAKITIIDVNLPLWYRFFIPSMSRHWPIKCTPRILPNITPCLIIAAGRQAFIAAAPLAKKIPTIALLNPKCPHDYFSVIIPPQHDGVEKHANVIETLGALHPHTADSFSENNTNGDFYTITVLLGGHSKHYTFKNIDFINIAKYLKEKNIIQANTRFLISTSRRTPENGIDILKSELSGLNATFWNGNGENPYFEYLGLANEILVTGDSISMLSEACYMGKPIEIWPVPIKNKRFLRFYDALTKNKHAVFAHEKWPVNFFPLRERDRVVSEIIKIFKTQAILR